jgi:hypothetical protein
MTKRKIVIGQSADEFGIPVTGNERHKGFAYDYKPRDDSARCRYMDEAEMTIKADWERGQLRTTRNVAYRTAARIGVGHDQLDAIEDAVVMLRRTDRVGMYWVRDGRTNWATYWTASATVAAQRLHGNIAALKVDRQAGQPHRVVLVAEATGMVPTLAAEPRVYGVEIMSGSGSIPLSAVHTIATDAVENYTDKAVMTVVLVITDFDLMGIRNIFVPFAQDVAAFAADLGEPKAVEVRRIAATPEQIVRWIPEQLRQPRPREKRNGVMQDVPWWPVDFSLPTAEAIEDQLPAILREAFNHYLPDAELRAQLIASETGVRIEAARELAKLLRAEQRRQRRSEATS